MRNPVNTTVLFTDLVDSTAVASRLGADDADELRRAHFSLLRRAVAENGGREVKTLGDGLMVTFGSVGSALDAAVAMQQAIDRHNRAGGEPLTIRIGVAVGDADEEEDGDLFGEPVVQAARLCAAADGGAILVPELLRHLTPRGAHEFSPVGDLELKGLPEPVAAAHIMWQPLEDEPDGVTIPLPARLAAPNIAEFVGRQAERERLESAGKAATTGERRGVIVAGEAGMGKTRLVTEVAATAHESGAVVLYGRCDEELAIPYQPWVEALGHYVAHADDAALDRHDRATLGELTRLVPQLARRVPDLTAEDADPATERHLLFGAVVQLLGEIARDQLCVVVLDDLHWADRATVQLLRQVLGSLDLGAVLVLGTYRDTDLDPEHPLTSVIANLHREPGVEAISLGGLGDDDVVALLASIAGHTMTEDGAELARAVRAETNGNPFFVGEVARHLAETGVLVQEDGRWVAAGDPADVGLPATVRAVVGERLRRLGDTAHRVLRTAAVIGREFELDTLVAASQLDEGDVLDALDAATAAGFVADTTRPDRFAFSHALVQNTLDGELTGARRVRLHQRVAEALEAALGDDPGERIGELANHWLAAARGDDRDKAVDYAERAGDHALAGLAFDEAAGWYRQGLDVLEQNPGRDPRRRGELLVGLGTAQRDSGDAAFRDTLVEAGRLAEQLDETDLLVRAALTNTRGWASTSGEPDFDRIELLERALDRLDDPDSAERARLLILASAERTFDADLDERLALAEDAVATARRSGDERALLQALGVQTPIMVPWTLDLRTAWVDEAAALASRSPDIQVRISAWSSARIAALERGDAEEYWRSAAAVEAAAEQLPHTTPMWTAARFRVVDALVRGDLDDAEQLADAALALGGEVGQPDAFAIWGAQWINIRLHQGRLAEAVPAIEQAVAEMPNLPVYGPVLAEALARSGNTDRARALLDDHVAAGFPMRADIAWSEAHAAWAGAAACTGHGATAALVRERVEPFADQIVTTSITVRPPFAHTLGQCDHVLGDHDRADAWYQQAFDIEERLGAPVLVAETQAAWAALIADRDRDDDRARAGELAATALDAATAGGYGDVEADARAVLERLS